MALTDANGAIVEAYSYSPFGELTVHIDSEGSEVHQLRARPGEVWLELTEEIDLEVLEQAFADESASLTNTATTETIPVTLERPVATGKLAGRRIVIRPEGDPLPADTPLALHLPGSSLEDLFGNEADEAFDATFVEPTLETIVVDTAAPLLDAVVVRDARLELRFTEEPSEATWPAITLDGEPTTWTLAEDRYTLLATEVLLPGTHTLTIPAAVTDLAGTALATPNTLELDVPLTNATFVAHDTPDPRTNPTSAADFRHTFHGLERDPTTGLVYARNRWYDPQMGRFVSPDPLGYVDGPSAYAFAGNDPANVSDPLGLWGQGEVSSKEKVAQQRSLQEARAQREAKCRADRFSVHCMSDFELNVAGHLGDESFSQPMLLEPTGADSNPIYTLNGIMNNRALAGDVAVVASRIFERDARPLWNPTRNPVFDIAQTALVNKRDIPDATTRLVARTLSEQLARLPASQNVTVAGHSQGAAIGPSAFTLNSSAERSRIDFVSIGGAACRAPADLNSRTFIINTRDVVPMFFGAGLAPCREVMEAEGPVSYQFYSFGDGRPSTSHSAQAYSFAIQTQAPSSTALESEARALLRSAASGLMKLDPAGHRTKAALRAALMTLP